MFSRLEMQLRRLAFDHGWKMVMSYRGELVLLEFVPRTAPGESELWTPGDDRSECELTRESARGLSTALWQVGDEPLIVTGDAAEQDLGGSHVQ